MIKCLDVMLWGRKVGTLVSAPKGYEEQICFYFDPDYVCSGVDIAPLRAPLSGVVAQRGLPVYPDEGREFGGLPSFIADSMPDRWGNMVFAEWAKAHRLRAKDLSPLDRLAYIGRRGMGALEFVPPVSAQMETPFRVEVSELSRLAHLAIVEAKDFRAVLSPDFVIESLFRVGTSAGGKRPKAVINLNPDTGECFSGQVPAPSPGFTPMIIKFDEHSDIPSTRIEYSYYLLAAEAGMEIMPSSLLEAAGEAHFLTERFDRRGDEKVHVQTLAAMNPSAASYDDLFEVAARLDVNHEEMRQLFLRMVMNVVCGNVDDHTKNFSFMMAPSGQWNISPAYDFTFSVDPSAPRYVNRHSLAVNGKREAITAADLQAVATRAGVKEPSSVIAAAISAARGYRSHARQAGVPEQWITKIEAEITARIATLSPSSSR